MRKCSGSSVPLKKQNVCRPEKNEAEKRLVKIFRTPHLPGQILQEWLKFLILLFKYLITNIYINEYLR